MKPYTPPPVTEHDLARQRGAEGYKHVQDIAQLMFSNPHSKTRPNLLVVAENGIGFRPALGMFLRLHKAANPNHSILCVSSSHLMTEIAAAAHDVPDVTLCTHPRLETLDPNEAFDLVFIEATRYGKNDRALLQPFLDKAKKVVWRLMATHKTPVADPSTYVLLSATTHRGIQLLPEKGDSLFQMNRERRAFHQLHQSIPA